MRSRFLLPGKIIFINSILGALFEAQMAAIDLLAGTLLFFCLVKNPTSQLPALFRRVNQVPPLPAL